MPSYAQVVLSFATTTEIDKMFTYQIDELLKNKIQLGHRVQVPFGRYNAPQIGYVIGLEEDIELPDYPLKTILELVEEEPILSSEQLEIAKFIVDYYSTSFAAALEAVLPPGLSKKPFSEGTELEEYIALNPEQANINDYISQNAHKKTFSKQRDLLEYLMTHEKVRKEELESRQAFSQSALKTLLKNQWLRKVQEEKQFLYDPICYDAFQILNEEQRYAKDRIIEALNQADYRTILLQGVTGSGKTEVFLYSIKEVIEKGCSAIVLVPEIALTQQTLERFRERFGNRVALTHSRMTSKERQKLYHQAKKGEVSVIIGPRSAVFMPLKNLKLVVIDEEHEATYKSESMPKYHAVDIAQMRMEKEKGVVLLASATPSIETYYQCLQGTYDKIVLKQRIGRAVLPEVMTVDMRLELKRGNNSVISQQLYEAIQDTLSKDQQVILLINRRGHSSFINCRSCGHVIKCSHCDVSMTYHFTNQSLECHYCGKKLPVPKECPVCKSKYIRFLGSGTEKVEQYLREHFEGYGIGRMDLDTTSGKLGHSKILEAFRQRQVNLLIGTQMIAKGHDFKDVTLVGIISADLSLYMQDFRSNEKTFQLVTQAIGRAGRGAIKGQVIIQTYNPEHIVFERIKAQAEEVFYEEELRNRELMGYPPFSNLFTVLISGKNEQEVISAAGGLTQYYRYYSEKGKSIFRVVGPSPAVIGKVADEYRWRIIILSKEREQLIVYGRYCLQKFRAGCSYENIKIQWDINPLSMM